MEKKKITVTMTPTKYDALEFSLAKKGTTIDKELEDTLEQMFQKTVGPPLRAFAEQKDGCVPADKGHSSRSRNDPPGESGDSDGRA